MKNVASHVYWDKYENKKITSKKIEPIGDILRE
jgi:hypothetical protein